MIGGILSLPLLLWQGGPPSGVGWLLLASILLECLYFILLSYAYTMADFSLVYPLARGTAPLFLTLWAWLTLAERPNFWGWSGLALLLGGLMLLGYTREALSSTNRRGLLAALGVALVISLYTLVDGIAVRQAEASSYALSIFTFLPPLRLETLRLESALSGMAIPFFEIDPDCYIWYPFLLSGVPRLSPCSPRICGSDP